MAEYPETFREFRAWFADDAACRAYLERVRWASRPRCPRCPDAKVWTSKPPFYRCAECGYDFTVTVGTLFADTHLPLSLWFEAIWYVVNQKNGASALGVQRVLGISYSARVRQLGHPTAPRQALPRLVEGKSRAGHFHHPARF